LQYHMVIGSGLTKNGETTDYVFDVSILYPSTTSATTVDMAVFCW